MSKGKFITFEGGEGAGKSTQTALLAQALRSAGIPVCTTREPGGSAGAEEIRRLLVTGETDRWDAMSEALLHFAARRDHLRRVVSPALQAGNWVLCDRFADSTMAYQSYGHGLAAEAVDKLYAIVVGDFAPDLTLVLDVPVELGLRRATSVQRHEDRYLNLEIQFHERVRQGFVECAQKHIKRCILIDGTESTEAISSKICEVVNNRFGTNLTVT